MTAAAQILEQFRETAGFDGWVVYNQSAGRYETVAGGKPHSARPAWREPDGSWYALPEGWEWVSISRCFMRGDWYVECHADLSWHIGDCQPILTSYDTAPDAFRAAVKWIEGDKND